MKSSQNKSTVAIILCAGSGQRSGLTYNKILHYVGKKTVLELTLDKFLSSKVDYITLVVSEEDLEAISSIAEHYGNIDICIGGKTRSDSVRAGLKNAPFCDVVVIHDGARPYVSVSLIENTIKSALNYGSGIAAVPTVDTIKHVDNGIIVADISREGLYNIQTPQAFDYKQITDAYNKVMDNCTDDSQVYRLAGYSPRVVIGDYDNFKLTTPNDFFRPATVRSKIGVGFDVHELVEGRDLVLGGVKIEFAKGLKGHSDADALVHAIMDALLSAAALPDIGVIFPDNDNKYRNIDSLQLLDEVAAMIARRGYSIANISAVIMAQAPKMSPYIMEMCTVLANRLKIDVSQIMISATTTERLGIIGEENGIACSASCMLLCG